MKARPEVPCSKSEAVSAGGVLRRREFLAAAATVLATTTSSWAALVPRRGEVTASRKPGKSSSLIDTNVTLGRWPFRRMPFDDTPALAAKLRERGVTQAWAGTFDGLFHKDIASANARLVEECRRHGRGWLLPFGSINPRLPDWEDELRRCAEIHRMAGVRLHPGYHGYPLDDPAFVRSLSLAQERQLVVQIVADMEDERTQHPLARVPHLDAKPLLALLKPRPNLRLLLLNWSRSVSPALVKQLAGLGVCFDIATAEGVGGVASLVQQTSAESVVFGSHAPLFYWESAQLKLAESALPAEEEQRVRSGNAQRLRFHS